jgi:NAD(P)-dependent dehydrogenase (short-subunit alcohol dehydrogenase family)
MKLQGKVAVVTGGARGLGRAYVLHLAALGAHVVINDVDLNAAQQYGESLGAATVAQEVESLGVRGLGIEADVTNQQDVDDMFAEIVSAFGKVDILVNNAGGALNPHPDNTASTIDMDYYHYIMDINLTGTIHCCRAAARTMREQRSGKIVNVGSQAGLWSGREGGSHVAYKVSKAGVIHYTRVLAAELGPYNINVNCIAPGFILSSRALASGRDSEEIRGRLLPQIPLGRMGVPEDCAKVVEFLVTDLSDYVTGQCIPVCGGYVAF